MRETTWVFPLLAVFWVYELLEAVGHVAYVIRGQSRPGRVENAFYFGTIKEAITNGCHVVFVVLLSGLGVLSTVDVALLGVLVVMHVGFTVDGLRKGHAVAAVLHGYDFGLLPFRSPPVPGPRLLGLAAKGFAHLDSALHVYFAVRVALLLPLPFVFLVLVVLAFTWRKIVVGGILIHPAYSAVVYGSHAATLVCAFGMR